MSSPIEIEIKLCETVELLDGCVELQRDVFDLPEIELSPVRHFIVTMHAGGFTLGAFDKNNLIGFCLSVPAFIDGERAFYSHMTAVHPRYQSRGIGSRLKWAQRERSLELGVKKIKWTFQPEKALNAFFNLEKLGAEVVAYMPNFYGTDYGAGFGVDKIRISSDRLFAIWNLDSEKVVQLAAGKAPKRLRKPVEYIETTANWGELLMSDRATAASEQERIRREFQDCFANGLVCRGFRKHESHPKYKLYER
ncbi:MAG: GNAT family N-acetyltransferase [Acidobacteriota bacterium]|nr:GNAT family N-acetyltransferase [Acidobacteriota bacterium]MDH3528726.1 GNAT family N-acetyltransferase [Acidobacteriota bacterium]